MHRSVKLFGVAAATASALVLRGPVAARATTTWHLIGCANTEISGAKICLYHSTGRTLQGRFVNGSSVDIKNQGGFYDGDGHVFGCGYVTTKKHTTATCTRTVSPGGYWTLQDFYNVNGSTQLVYVDDPHKL